MHHHHHQFHHHHQNFHLHQLHFFCRHHGHDQNPCHVRHCTMCNALQRSSSRQGEERMMSMTPLIITLFVIIMIASHRHNPMIIELLQYSCNCFKASAFQKSAESFCWILKLALYKAVSNCTMQATLMSFVIQDFQKCLKKTMLQSYTYFRYFIQLTLCVYRFYIDIVYIFLFIRIWKLNGRVRAREELSKAAAPTKIITLTPWAVLCCLSLCISVYFLCISVCFNSDLQTHTNTIHTIFGRVLCVVFFSGMVHMQESSYCCCSPWALTVESKRLYFSELQLRSSHTQGTAVCFRSVASIKSE